MFGFSNALLLTLVLAAGEDAVLALRGGRARPGPLPARAGWALAHAAPAVRPLGHGGAAARRGGSVHGRPLLL